MSSVIIKGDTSGQITLSAPAVAGTNTLTLPTSTGTVALTSDVIGVSQSWSAVTGSRTSGTTYTNSTGKPIQVQFNIQSTSSSSLSVVVDGVTIYTSGAVGNTQSVNFIVPNGSTYSITWTNRNTGVWAELR